MLVMHTSEGHKGEGAQWAKKWNKQIKKEKETHKKCDD